MLSRDTASAFSHANQIAVSLSSLPGHRGIYQQFMSEVSLELFGLFPACYHPENSDRYE